MKQYGNSEGSRVLKYDIGEDYIDFLIKGNEMRRYSHFCTGKTCVDKMKEFIRAEEGLWSYINAYCKDDYEALWKCKDKYFVSEDMLPFTENMQTYNVMPYLADCNYYGDSAQMQNGFFEVCYHKDVPDEENIPGLTDFIRAEASHIVKTYNNLNTTYYHYVRPELCIELSPYAKYHRYNDLNDRELKDAINKILGKCPYIEGSAVNILQKLFEKESLDSAIEKFGIMYDTLIGCDDVNTEKALKKVMELIKRNVDRREYVENVSGIYSPEEHKIVIFYRNLHDTDGLDAYLADLRLILSHELMHYFHHRNSWSTFAVGSDRANRVKEALADFFSVVYCADQNNNIWRAGSIGSYSRRFAEDRYHKWKHMDNSFWPYAYALYIMRIKGKGEMKFSDNTKKYDDYGSIEKFFEVMVISEKDMDRAYEYLIEG